MNLVLTDAQSVKSLSSQSKKWNIMSEYINREYIRSLIGTGSMTPEIEEWLKEWLKEWPVGKRMREGHRELEKSGIAKKLREMFS